MVPDSTQKVLSRLAETLVNVAVALESIGLNGSIPRKNTRKSPKRSDAQRKSWKTRRASARSKKVWASYTPEQRAERVAKMTSSRYNDRTS